MASREDPRLAAPWARVLTIVLALFELLRFPFGTCLGVYSLGKLETAADTAVLCLSLAQPLETENERTTKTEWQRTLAHKNTKSNWGQTRF